MMCEAGPGREPATTPETQMGRSQLLHLVAVRRQHVTSQVGAVRCRKTTHAARDVVV